MNLETLASGFILLMFLWGLFEVVLGILNIKNNQVKLGGWGSRRTVTNLPAKAFGVVRIGYGLVIAGVVISSEIQNKQTINTVEVMIVTIVIYSILASLSAYLLQYFDTQRRNSLED